MIIYYFLSCSPLIQCIFSNGFLALGAEIFNFGLVRITVGVDVLKGDIHYELCRDHLVLIFANVFRAELHLARLDVVTSLDKRRIEHDSEHYFVRKASLRVEDDLHIALQNCLLLLLFTQLEDTPALFRAVVLLDWESKLLSYVQTAAAKDLKIGLAPA